MCVTLHTGTFFCVTATAQSVPLIAMDVIPPWLTALNAYSVKNNRDYSDYFEDDLSIVSYFCHPVVLTGFI